MVFRNELLLVVVAGVLFTSGWSLAKEPLVPGFGAEDELPPIPGFGAAGEFFSVRVSDEDRRTVDERFRRYDSNRDGFLSREELARNRWSDDPLFYDRNHDGRLSKDEMAIRYARRRMDAETDRLMKFYIALDRNKNKILEPQEIASSQYRSTIEQKIRDAGMDPTRPIPLSSFMSKRLKNAGIKKKQIKKAVKSLGSAKRKGSGGGSREDGRGQEEANRLMTFYVSLDRNGNHVIEPEEYADNWSRSRIEQRIREAGMDPSKPIPLKSFLSKRLAKAGIKSAQIKKAVNSLGSPRSKDGRSGQSEDGRRSYRFKTAHERLPLGIPQWFREKDRNQDGQVAMAEYLSSFTDEGVAEGVAEFRKFDLNGDGLITPRECMASHSEEPVKRRR